MGELSKQDRLSRFDPLLVHPKVLIVSCTADIAHTDSICKELFDDSYQYVRGHDYLEFLHPGSFPVNESLDAIAEVTARFAVEKIAVITHADCGLIDAYGKIAEGQDSHDLLFSGYGSAVLKELNEFGVSAELISESSIDEKTCILSKLIAYRISKRLTEKAQFAVANENALDLPETNNHRRLANLNQCQIRALSSLHSQPTLKEVIPWTTVSQVATPSS